MKLFSKIYNGAFENATLSGSSRRALYRAGGIVLGGFIIGLIIRKNGRL